MKQARVCCLLFALASGTCGAQDFEPVALLQETSAEYVIRHWGMAEGLPSDRVRAVVQTSDGYIWAATFNGLARFDGVRFQVFDDANTPALKNRLINCLFEDSHHRLWIGSDTGEIAWRDDRGFHALEVAHPWPVSPIVRVVETRSGTLLFLNRNGMILPVRALVPREPIGRAGGLLYSELAMDAAQQVWAVRRGGQVVRLDEEQEVQGVAGPPVARGYRTVIAARQGGLWVRDGQWLRRWEEGTWVEDRGWHEWGLQRPVAMIESTAGEVVVGTVDRGAFVVGKDGQAVHVSRATGLRDDWVTSLWEDRERNLWLGTGGGGLQLLRQRALTMITPADRWQLRPVESVCASERGGVLIGTLGAGVYRLGGGTCSRLANGDDSQRANVRCVLEDRTGRIWMGTEGGGLYAWEEGRSFKPDSPVLVPGLVYALHETPEGAIWAGTQNGVVRVHGDVWERLGTGLTQADVRCVVESPSGEIWLGMRGGGVARYRDGQFTQFLREDGLPYEYVWAMAADPEGTIWIGTSGGGLARHQNGRFTNFTLREGLPSDFICHIEPDDAGYLWVASYAGIFRVDTGELERVARGELASVNPLVFDASEGLTSLEMSGGNHPSGCRTPDGRLWFATSGGLAVIDPERITVVRVPPPVVIEQVVVDGRVMTPGPAGDRAVIIPPGSVQVEILYSALSFGAPGRVKFKYRLEGLETEWLEAGNRRSAFYTRMPPGDYRFRVIACNHFGYWNEAGEVLHLKVLPFFWQMWWFAPLCWTGGALLVGGGVVSGLRRRHQRRLETMERERLIERERARIAHDLHDDLGTGLTEIHTTSALGLDPSVPADEAQDYFREISHRAQEMVSALDEIVWAVNPRNDNLGSLTSYFCHFAEHFLKPTGITCRFDVQEHLPDVRLASNQRHSLFLAFKEALNNAVRHSQAENVTIRLSVADSALRLSVTDDGCGFASVPDHPGADGLTGMCDRLTHLGGQGTISSSPGRGTVITFVLPLRSGASEAGLRS